MRGAMRGTPSPRGFFRVTCSLGGSSAKPLRRSGTRMSFSRPVSCTTWGTYAMIATSAESKGIAFAQEFADVYGSGLGTLGGDAARAWGLPQVFYAAIEFSEVPSESTEEQTALYCIHYANYLAVKMGARIEPWAYDPQLDALAQSEVGLDEEEIEAVLQVVDGQTTAYISAASAGLAA
jgi:hypothetical protein